MVETATQVGVAMPVEETIDLAFALRGSGVPLDYADALRIELRRCLPWLEDEAAAGVHPLGGVSEGNGQFYLSGRSRLILRLPRGRIAAALDLSGRRLDLGGEVEVGGATVRELAPATALYSSFVAWGPAGEAEFLVECRRAIDALEFANPRLICGKPRRAGTTNGELHGFSLMVHGLGHEESLRLQRSGLGRGRKLGCGIFVPHKSIAAVGEA